MLAWTRAMVMAMSVAISVGAPAALALDPSRDFASYAIDRYSLEAGLPQISALSITQDSTGYLWIGSQSWLSRFDGVRFEVFDRVRAGGVDTTFVDESFADSKGGLWFSARRGSFRLVRGRFERTPVPDDHALLAFAEGHDGTLYASSAAGLLEFRNGRFERSARTPEGSAAALLTEDRGLWVGGAGAAAFVGKPARPQLMLPAAAGNALITQLIRDGQRYWLGTSRGLYVADADGVRAAPLDGDEARPILALLRDGQRNVWVSTVERMYRFRPNGALEKIAARELMRTPWVTSIFVDREENLWLGSQTESLFRLWSGWAELNTLPADVDPLTWCLSLDPDGRTLIVGNNDGLAWLRDREVVRRISGSALPNPAVYTLHRAASGALYIGTRNGLARLDRDAPEPVEVPGFAGMQINAIVDGNPNELIIGTTRGLYSLTERGIARIDRETSLLGQQFRALFVDRRGIVYAGSEAGLHLRVGTRFQRAELNLAADHEFVTTITRLGPEALVIGSYASGLFVHLRGEWWSLSQANGLPNDNVWSVVDGGDGYAYLSSASGAYRLALDQLLDPKQRVHTPQMLLSMSRAQRGAQHARCCNGGGHGRALKLDQSLWYTSIVGPIRLDLAAIAQNPVAPTVVIEEIRAGLDRYPLTEELRFAPARDVEIHFTGFSFRDPKALEFDYQLLPDQREWREISDRRSVHFANLKPGSYRFLVRARNESNQPSMAPAALSFTMAPHWYETTASKVTAATLVLGLFALFAWWSRRLALRREAALGAIVSQRTAQLERLNRELKLSNEALAHDSQTDLLTGLYNRRHFYRQISQRLTTLKRLRDQLKQDLVLLIVMIDLDRFKRINDRYGHAAGDELLRTYARTLEKARDSDADLVRWGGEEFILLIGPIPKLAVPARIDAIARECTLEWTAPNKPEFSERLTASIGYALIPAAGEDPFESWDLSLEWADDALRFAKHEGRNRAIGIRYTGPQEVSAERLRDPLDTLIQRGDLALVR
jgi:diguanylate cyclase (GGDEF)-like protein